MMHALAWLRAEGALLHHTAISWETAWCLSGLSALLRHFVICDDNLGSYLWISTLLGQLLLTELQ